MGSSRVDADRLKGPGFDNFFPPELGITEAEIDRCIEDAEGAITVFPQRPGHPVCDFFMKTGHCKFNEQCKFDHPRRYAVKLNKGGLPLRPCEAVCGFYERTGQCKFGPACKFHHPQYEEGHQFGETAALSAFAGGEAGRPRKQGEGKRRSHDT
ncbi:hypothetical protein WJX72_005071 [[Myrmecia] bisecta]|uniref:C3H1-type domain-containing protein n=1 Tax=[Myrmecia] bisecta TaxID=41462 RepID=A0AAW1QRP2_9CHLO